MDTTGERQYGKIIDEIEPKHVERYKYASNFCVGKRVLDSACGVGYGSKLLSLKASFVKSVDFSDDAIDYANKYWLADNIDFGVFDLNSESFKILGKFDVVVCFETIEHLSTPLFETMNKFFDIINNNGLFVVSHPEKEPVCNNKFHCHFNIDGKKFTKDLLKIGFKIEEDWLQPGRFKTPYHIVVARRT